jgi:hypothetical protein
VHVDNVTVVDIDADAASNNVDAMQLYLLCAKEQKETEGIKRLMSG